MASATRDTSVDILRTSFGSLQIHIITFSNIDDTDTYVSGVSRIVGYWANGTNDPSTATNTSIDVAESSGTFTFSCGEDTRAGMLYVLSERTV